MISNMISLMADTSAFDEAKRALSEIGFRVSAVSELYDLLYSTDSIIEVRLDKYLTKIVSSLINISTNISLTKTCDAVTIPVKDAIPIGIITTELITNSIKHAFPGKKSGTIELSLKKPIPEQPSKSKMAA
ncbi:MAG: sensor histidine kinase [bacterium]|nr:sensor histidine kinase [bacterium]